MVYAQPKPITLFLRPLLTCIDGYLKYISLIEISVSDISTVKIASFTIG